MKNLFINRLKQLMLKGSIILLICICIVPCASAARLKAGVAKKNITIEEPDFMIHDSLFVRAIVFENGDHKKAVIIAIDAISLTGSGTGARYVPADYIDQVRITVEKELNIYGDNILFNASHNHNCRNQISKNVVAITVGAVKDAYNNMVAVKIGSGSGYDDRISMNRRLILKDGGEWSIRHSNPCPPDEEVAATGPFDPEIGILRVDRLNGKPLAVLYNFGCHTYADPYGAEPPYGGTTADFPGVASSLIEENLGNGAIALFLQGAGGDITTMRYKDVNQPRDAESFGYMLGLSTLKALKDINPVNTDELSVIAEQISLPLRKDIPSRIDSLKKQESALLSSLRGTSLNFKTFIPLYIKYNLFPEYPSYYKHLYLHEEKAGVHGLKGLDAENRRNIEKYLRNVLAMEKLCRIQDNLNLLRSRQQEIEREGSETISVEIQGMRIGEYILVSFPGEVFAKIGLDLKEKSPYKYTFVAGYSNGYIDYLPTAEGFNGWAYEDTNCILAPEWHETYEQKALEIISRL
jgi:hypothetical protein